MTHPEPIESPLRSLIKGTPMHEMTDAERAKFIGVKRLIRENGRKKMMAKGKRSTKP